MPQAVIIGAGPAGSTAAILLASRGWQVHLVEQRRFPRDKVCGECLSPLAQQVLARLDMSITGPLLTRARLVAPSGSEFTTTLGEPILTVPRRTLDSLLLDRARSLGVTVHQPARCELIRNGHALLRDPGGMRELSFEHLLIADGQSALLAARPSPTGDLGVKAHFRFVDADPGAISLFGLPGHYCGLAYVGDGAWNVAMNIPASRARKMHGRFDSILSENLGLARCMRRAKRITEWLASPLPRFAPRNDWPEKVVPIGNAAAALEPIGGQGIGLAMRSAELAVECLRGRTTRDTLQQEYRRLWNRRSSFCRLGAMAIASPALGECACALMSANNRLADWLIRAGSSDAVLS